MGIGYFLARGGGNNIGAKMLELTFPKHKKAFIFDCGTGQKPKKQSQDNTYLPNMDGLNPDYEIAVFLTHGHQDHVGAAPILFKKYPKAKFFATATTLGITRVMGNDSIKIRNESGLELHYTSEELDHFLNSAKSAHSSEWLDLGNRFQVRFQPAGHISGAATVILQTPYGAFADSGDINFYNTATVIGASLKLEGQLRWLSVESTNGNVTLEHPEKILERLEKDVFSIIRRGGNVLIPAFAVGRGPDIAIRLGRRLKRYGIRVWSGGLLRKAAEVCHSKHWESDIPFKGGSHLNYQREPVFNLREENVYWVNQRNFSRVSGGRGIVTIVPNGMLEAGYSQEFLIEWAEKTQNAIFLPSYQTEGTCGREILELKNGETISLFSLMRNRSFSLRVLAQVKQYRISGHADGNQLTQWVANIDPADGKSLDKVFLVHGNPDGQEGLKNKLLTLPNAPKEILIGANHQLIEI